MAFAKLNRVLFGEEAVHPRRQVATIYIKESLNRPSLYILTYFTETHLHNRSIIRSLTVLNGILDTLIFCVL